MKEIIYVKDVRRFIIRERKSKTEITRSRAINLAKEIVERFEEEDKEDGIYEENFYEIYDDYKKEIVL